MSRIAKIYCSAEELPTLAPGANLLEAYDAFQLVGISRSALKKASADVPVEDVTDLYRVKVAGKTLDTGKPGVATAANAAGRATAKPTAGPGTGAHHYLVQFLGPVKDEWIKQVQDLGGEYRSPYADFTLIFRLKATCLTKVQALPFVRWVGHLSHASRVAKGVGGRAPKTKLIPDDGMTMGKGGTRLRDTVVVQFFDNHDLVAAKPKFKRCGATVLTTDPGGLAVLRVPTTAAKRKATIEELSAIHGVRLITSRVVPMSRNNVASAFMGIAAAVSTGGLGLTGAGEIVAIADTGLDTGSARTVMPDFAGRVKSIHSWPIDASFDAFVNNPGADDGPADVSSGHGTHVAGSAVGGGSPGPGNSADIRGLAHGAKLVFQAVEQKLDFASPAIAKEFRNDPYQLVGLPTNLAHLFDQAYAAGARIHSNSWGGGYPGEYSDTSRMVDEYVWKTPDFCVLVAAGNDGTDAQPGSDGIVNEGSVSSPGTAKNCITIGASETERPEFASATYQGFWPQDFPKAPVAPDKVADSRDHMAAFSSRGPTLDGRTKPDVVAPGTFILSTRSTRIPPTTNGWAPYPANDRYMFEGGTSMATPLAAGAVALVREYFRTKLQTPSPSAALLKATLICGARRMSLPYVPAGVGFDNHQGFGRIDLDSVLAPGGGAKLGFHDAAPGLKTGKSFQTTINVAGTQPLRVVLAYSDYPGRGLKNNLNLMLTAQDGRRWVGNAMGNTLSFDTRNNVEVVEVATPAAGTWRVQVLGANVPKGPQRFALVWLA